MKILTIKEAKQNKDREDLEKRLRSKEISDEYSHRLALLNSLNDEWDASLKRQRDEYASEKEAHAQWRNAMQAEVMELELRHAQALLPIQQREENVALAEGKLSESLASFEKKEKELEDMKDLLQKRLDDAASLNLQNEQAAKRLFLQEKGIESQRESIRQQSSELSMMMQRFTEGVSEQQKEHAAAEARFLAREDLIELRSSGLDSREAELNGREARLKIREHIAEETFNKYRQYGNGNSIAEEGRK